MVTAMEAATRPSMGAEPPRIGQWYLRSDEGRIFQVTGYDEMTHMTEIQSLDGDWDEIDEKTWASLPLQPVGSYA